MTDLPAAPPLALAVALGALAALPAAGVSPVYLQRLSLPVAGDDIGYGQCVTADAHTGEVFVCDPRTNRLLIFDAEGQFDFQIVGGLDLASPEDLAVDPEGILVLLARRGANRLPVELDFDGLFRREIPLVGLPLDSRPVDLVSIALSPAGDRLYVADAANSMLWIADRDGLVLTGVDLAADVEPEDLGDFTVGHVDVYGERVLVSLPMSGIVKIFSLEGEPRGFVGVPGGGGCQLSYPVAAAADRDGVVLVLDAQRMLVLRWRIADNECLSEHIGLGRSPGRLYFPNDLSLDPAGRLYVSQSAQGWVQVFGGLGAAPAPPDRVAEAAVQP